MITGNKGEWSEIYTLLKLLGDGKLYKGDKNLNQVKSFYYPILKILRSESSRDLEFNRELNIIIVNDSGSEIIRIPPSTFISHASKLLTSIKNGSATFSVPTIENFMKTFSCYSIKASSSVKSDIQIVIHDKRTSLSHLLGFSIKSQLGGNSTLLNASKATNINYKIDGVDPLTSNCNLFNVNTGRGWLSRKVNKVISSGGKFSFKSFNNNIFKNNVELVDSRMPEIISSILLERYISDETDLDKLLSIISLKNPLKFDTSKGHNFYTYKIKRFLTDVALGLMPNKVWDGVYDSTGGYLIVKDNGDIISYHIYDKNEFEDYLVHNTYLETPSTTRHEFGDVFIDNSEMLFRLCLQIRFRN